MSVVSQAPALRLTGVAKSFVLHLRDGLVLPVVENVTLSVRAGECVVLSGPSGAGKSSILRMIHGNYRCEHGQIQVHDGEAMIDLVGADPREVLRLRHGTIGYVSQFLRVIPRVAALDIVAHAAIEQGLAATRARERAARLLERLNVPERLWGLPPATFSGGEQQRVNIARGFITHRRVLLLDEPTASLDTANSDVVIDLIAEQKRAGSAILGIFHDEHVRDRVADRLIDVTDFAAAPVRREAHA